MTQQQPEPWWKAKNPQPPVPTAEQADAMASGVGQVLVVVAQAMEQVYASADGIRTQMLARGYSETAAEQAALQQIMLAQNAMWQGESS